MNNQDDNDRVNSTQESEVAVLDATGRRSFIRKGAAFVGVAAAGAMATTSTKVYADDCDQFGGEKNATAPNTDADSGESADRQGCGRNPEKPKISRRSNPLETRDHIGVAKIKV